MPKKQDVWSEGSGLFDLNNLKSGDKTLLEFKPNNAAANPVGTKKEDDIWGGIGILGGNNSLN